MNDDFNSPLLIGHLFEAVKFINSVVNKQKSITSSDLVILKKSLHDFIYNVLGLCSQNLQKMIQSLRKIKNY